VKPGDVLVSMNGKEYKKIRDVQRDLLSYAPQVLVHLEWKREGTERSAYLALNERPFSPIELGIERDTRENLFVPLFGISVVETERYFWERSYVIKKVYKGSIGDETGLSVNDPLIVQKWEVDTDERLAFLQIFVKKQKAGFLESAIQLASYLELDFFI